MRRWKRCRRDIANTAIFVVCAPPGFGETRLGNSASSYSKWGIRCRTASLESRGSLVFEKKKWACAPMEVALSLAETCMAEGFVNLGNKFQFRWNTIFLTPDFWTLELLNFLVTQFRSYSTSLEYLCSSVVQYSLCTYCTCKATGLLTGSQF